jgi:hypothetical protein
MTIKHTLPSVEYLNECFNLDTENGILYWKPRPMNHFNSLHEYSGWNKKFAYTIAGSLITKNLSLSNAHYRRVSILKKCYKLHRVIFKMYYGYEPEYIDHIDGDPRNNRPINLRSVTMQENLKNKAVYKNHNSGINGIKEVKHGWQVRNKNARKIFKTLEEAIEYKQIWNEENGFHPNHGRQKIVV